ncbi:MAG TPA: MFS transporter, partial [Anaerolineae bacterium]|nr:MFS transporter [Anaerolineae bacterium]
MKKSIDLRLPPGAGRRGGEHVMHRWVMDAPDIRWSALTRHAKEGHEEDGRDAQEEQTEYDEQEHEHAAQLYFPPRIPPLIPYLGDDRSPRCRLYCDYAPVGQAIIGSTGMNRTNHTNRKNVALLSLTLGIVMLGFGMVMPIMPFYVESMGASATELGLLVAISPFIQLVASPIWGGISDRHGRKPVLAAGLLGYALSMLFFGLSTELWMLFVARGVGALLSAATMPTTMAYVGDSTADEERGGGMGALGAATGLGMVLGPALGGLLGSHSLSTPFFLTAAVCLVTLLLVLLFLPESLPPQAGRQAADRIQPLAGVRSLWRKLFGSLGVLFFMAFLVSFGLTNFQGIFGYYALQKFGYGTREVGWILTVVGIVAALTQGVLTGPLTKKWGEATVIKATLLGSAVTFALLLAADNLPA